MTYDEAIKTLRSTYIDIHGGDCAHLNYSHAISMATEALEKVKKSEETFEWCTDCKEYDHEHYRCNRWNKRIRNTIEELRGSTMWIPCEDMLPEIGQQVLCCNDDGRVFTSSMHKDKVAYDGTYIFGQHWGVIAWMPLPKPMRLEELDV